MAIQPPSTPSPNLSHRSLSVPFISYTPEWTPPRNDKSSSTDELVSAQACGASPIRFDDRTWNYSDVTYFVNSKLSSLRRTPNLFVRGKDRDPQETPFATTPFAFNQVMVNKKGLNASRIDFPKNDLLVTSPANPGKYIVGQAPLITTIVPFMEMLVQESIPLIVSLGPFTDQNSKIIENGYIPPRTGEVYTSSNCEYKITRIETNLGVNLTAGWSLQRGSFELELLTGEKHSFTHFHVPEWKDGDPCLLLPLLNLVHMTLEHREKHCSPYAPILVHCNTGCDKSGIFINLCEITDRFLKKQPVVIPEIAIQSRMQRPFLGGTEDQYVMLFKALEKLQGIYHR